MSGATRIFVDLPVGVRRSVLIPNEWHAQGVFYYPRRPRTVWGLYTGMDEPPSTPPLSTYTVRPTGDYEYSVTPDGVTAWEVWRAE